MGLVCSVETFRGCSIQLVRRTSGFNGLSTNRGGEVRKIEVKSMERSFHWIAISGSIAIDKLFFERDYWIYFVLLPRNQIVMTKGLPFLKQQLSFTANQEFVQNLQDWARSTRKLTRGSGLKFIPKLQLKFPVPLDSLVDQITRNPDDRTWHGSVIEIWENKRTWERLFLAPDVD